MLPPRSDDKVSGRIGTRFVAELAESIAAGRYMPTRASIVSVPKTRLATRPAALLTLADRVVYEALVEPMRKRIDAFLVSESVVLWPRGFDTDKRWNDFEIAPVSSGGGYVVIADVAGFYESIAHLQLQSVLIQAGVQRRDAEALTEFLGLLMGASKGLPQGVATSDSLATAYLATADAVMRRTGISYWRHGDDIRMSASTYPEARMAAHALEEALRQIGLLLNSAKLRVLSYSTYAAHQRDLECARQEFRERLLNARREAIRKDEEPEALEELMRVANLDEDMQWGFWYHNTIQIDEVLDALREHIAPSLLEVHREIFIDAMARRPGSEGGLNRELWHARIAFCLRRFADARSPVALPYASRLLIQHPDETQFVSSYLLSLVEVDAARVAQVVEYALGNAGFLLGWQRGWLYRVLSRVAGHVGDLALDACRQVMRSDDEDWFARVEAARLLGVRGCLEHHELLSLHKNAPAAFRTDIFEIAAGLENTVDWARSFLDGVGQDPLAKVVVDGVRSRSGS